LFISCSFTGSLRLSEQDKQALLPGRLARNSVAPFGNPVQSPYQAQQLATDSKPAGMIERLQSGIRLAPLPLPLKTQRNRWSEGQQLQSVGSHAWPDRPNAVDGIGRLGSLEAGSALLPSGLDAAQTKQDAAGSAQSQPAVQQPGSDANRITADNAEHVTGIRDRDSSVGPENKRDTIDVKQSRSGRKWWQSVLLVRHLQPHMLPMHGDCVPHQDSLVCLN
jgi:hypothetical protein